MASSTSETSQNLRSGSPWIIPGTAPNPDSTGTTENSAKTLFRVDAAHSTSATPHTVAERPTRSPRIPLSSPARKRLLTPESESPSQNDRSAADQPAHALANPNSNAQQLPSQPSPTPQQPDTPLPPERGCNTSNESSWHVLHAENIAEILEKRLYEVERREHLLNRRAAQLAMDERKFRLWAQEEKMLLRQQQREHAVRQEELNRRSADLRWLLLMEDAIQTDTGSDFGRHSPQADSLNSMAMDASSEFFENFCESFEELFQEDSNGIRRLKNS